MFKVKINTIEERIYAKKFTKKQVDQWEEYANMLTPFTWKHKKWIIKKLNCDMLEDGLFFEFDLRRVFYER